MAKPSLRDLITEARRRRVFRVAALYVVGAWVLLQVADNAFPAFGIPETALRYIYVGVILAFPFAIIFGWRYDFVDGRLTRTLTTDPSADLSLSRVDYIVLASLALVVAAIAIGLGREISVTQAPASESDWIEDVNPTSIVVLPFVNMSSDVEQEYFSDGISEELLNLLAKIPELRVTSRTSAFSYKGKDVKLVDVARELKVAHVLEGSVRRDGERVRITAQLIDANTDSHLWSETFDRDIGDIFAVQDEIAASVVEELEITLLGKGPDVRRTSPEAYSLFLQAQHIASQGTPRAYRDAIQLLRRALSIDESYAPAWSLLSSVFSSEVNSGLRPVSEGIEDARNAANKALELDPELASAHIEMARIAMTFDWNIATAITHLRAVRAKDLRLLRAALLALQIGRFDLAVDWAQQVAHLDPVSTRAHRILGYSLFVDGRFAEAEQSFQNAIRLSPGSVHVQLNMAMMRIEQGMPAEALQIAERIPVEEIQIYLQSMAKFALGDIRGSDEELDLYIDKFNHESASGIAAIYAFREEPDLAFQWLEKALENRDNAVSSILFVPPFRNLDSHPRMQPFLYKLGLSDEEIAAIELDLELVE